MNISSSVLNKAEANDKIDNNKGHIDERQNIVNDCTKKGYSESTSWCEVLGAMCSNGLHESLGQHSLIVKENDYVEEDDEKGKDETEEKPDVDVLDAGGCWQAAGHWDVESGENHQTGYVDRDDRLQEVLIVQVVGGLVDDVDNHGRQVGHKENTRKISSQLDFEN